MGEHAANSKRLAGAIVLGAVASGLAAAALGSAGPASATCASISGFGDGGGCHSGVTDFAVGVGPNTFASADGLFSGAVAQNADPASFSTAIVTSGFFSTAVASGPNTHASTNGPLSNSFVQGSSSSAQANGVATNAFSFGGTNNIVLAGVPTGVQNPAPGFFTTSFNVLGSNNDIGSNGPFATAGAIGVSNNNTPATFILRGTPGFNINHVNFP